MSHDADGGLLVLNWTWNVSPWLARACPYGRRDVHRWGNGLSVRDIVAILRA